MSRKYLDDGVSFELTVQVLASIVRGALFLTSPFSCSHDSRETHNDQRIHPRSPHGKENQIKTMNTHAKGPCLSVIASRTLSQPIYPHLMSFCPTMDLLAVVTHEERVEVHRLNGQRAFGLQRKSQGVKVESLCWKYNGIGF